VEVTMKSTTNGLGIDVKHAFQAIERDILSQFELKKTKNIDTLFSLGAHYEITISNPSEINKQIQDALKMSEPIANKKKCKVSFVLKD
ncbi:MAG: hypothetical protein K2X81_06695, partial [Candidatus Obscuribacterales bacterium]|nr:hypothetical protein [Candidatus Obscuribacterales bacterium]